VLAEVSTLDLQNRNKNYSRTARSGLGRPGLQRLLLRKLLVANLSNAAPKSGASASEQPDSDPAGAQYIWALDKRE